MADPDRDDTERLHTHYADDATLARLLRLEEGQVRLQEALRELYEAAHDYLNAPDDAGWISEGTPRLNAALGVAFKALHERSHGPFRRR